MTLHKSAQESAFTWSKQRERGAGLVADDTMSDEQIAAQLGVARRTLAGWKAHPDFQERVAGLLERYRRAVQARGISERQNRVAELDRRWQALRQVIEERGADPSMADVPGGKTGLLVRSYKSIGSGEFAERVEEFRVDVGTLKELREHEKQAAQELGQWEDEAQGAANDDAKILRIVIDTEALEAI